MVIRLDPRYGSIFLSLSLDLVSRRAIPQVHVIENATEDGIVEPVHTVGNGVQSGPEYARNMSGLG